MRTPVFIPFVNRPDLLKKAVASIPQDSNVVPVIINNSTGSVDGCGAVSSMIVNPEVPLSFTQSQNLMLSIAKEQKLPFYMWMHCDAEAEPGTIEKLYEMATQHIASGEKWSVIFTLYDVVCVYNTEAFDVVGGYDTVFSSYFSDNDVYHRLRLAGYPTLESHLPVKHVGSQTINSDPYLKLVNGITFPLARQYYVAKWGGEPGQETFKRPFDRMF